ncbi:MAG: 7TM-DISM domain-containing protein, partial [Gemmatimonas sp.]
MVAACLVVLLSAAFAWPAWSAAASPPQAPPSAQPLQPGDTMRVLGAAELSMLRDPGGTLGIDAVSAPGLRPQFHPVATGVGVGYTEDVIWVRVELQRTGQASAHWRLELTATVLDDVRLF